MSNAMCDEEFMFYQELGRRIRRARAERGMSQSELSKALGYSSPTVISYYETAVRKPGMYAVLQLSRILDAPTLIFLDTDASGAPACQRMGQEQHRFRGYLPLIQEDGGVTVFGVSSGYNDLGASETAIFDLTEMPDVVVRTLAEAKRNANHLQYPAANGGSNNG